jgi:hypothetical protein
MLNVILAEALNISRSTHQVACAERSAQIFGDALGPVLPQKNDLIRQTTYWALMLRTSFIVSKPSRALPFVYI